MCQHFTLSPDYRRGIENCIVGALGPSNDQSNAASARDGLKPYQPRTVKRLSVRNK